MLRIPSLQNNTGYQRLNKQNNLSFGIKDGKYQVKLVDSNFENHATLLQKLAYSLASNEKPALEKKIDVEINKINIAQNPKDILDKLKQLNNKAEVDPDSIDYLMMPLFSKVSLAFLSRLVSYRSNAQIDFTPENLLENKEIVRETLKDVSENQEKYKDFISEFRESDPYAQGLEFVYPTIIELEKLKQKNINVFIIGNHSYLEPLKALAKTEGLKPELYNYIATGKDPENKIARLIQKVEQNKSYEVNLYDFSDINKVYMLKPNGTRHIYTNKDGDLLVNTAARGTFNLSPVRENGNLVGYSFIDEAQTHFSNDEFKPDNQIERFVGLPLRKFLAKNSDYEDFKKYLGLKKHKESKAGFEGEEIILEGKIKDKLFKINDPRFEEIFSKKEIKDNKMLLKGDYVDYQMLFFRENDKGQVIFPNTDCEGSGRPSVCSMFGVCLALVQAVINDVKQNFSKS